MSDFIDIKRIYARALDPVHIGEGGYRLGRVDNTIVRDPATDVPKVPGTSMAGVTKEFYTIHLKGNNVKSDNTGDNEDKNVKTYFGDGQNQGMLRFYDGQIIFFPVSTSQGTVWITTKELFEYWFNNKNEIDDAEDNACAIKGIEFDGFLNLGWILLDVKKNSKEIKTDLHEIDRWIKKAVVVSDRLFSNIVNDNLEVRTSVRINPKTGTAEDGGLFTYEAIPRGTVLGFEIAIDIRKSGAENENILNDVIKQVSQYFKLLGIGGMGTRGFGRIELSKSVEIQQNEGGNSND